MCSGEKMFLNAHFEVWNFLLQVPNVKWEDVGGLEDVKKSILDTVQVYYIDCYFPYKCPSFMS